MTDHAKTCDFCKGQPVGNAATWVDGKPRPPAQCPRCGETNTPAPAPPADTDVAAIGDDITGILTDFEQTVRENERARIANEILEHGAHWYAWNGIPEIADRIARQSSPVLAKDDTVVLVNFRTDGSAA